MKVAIFIPYFTPLSGGLPNYFEYWQKSAAANDKIDFYIPSNVDGGQYVQYHNIHFITMDVNEFWDKIQALLGFDIVRGYYKIAEYKPLWGLLFKDILNDYDYWGYGDLDLIYGDILKFIQPFLDRGEEVIGKWGHFRLIKNTDKLRMLPFENARQIKHPLNMKEAFSTEFCCYWDEILGMGLRCYQAGINVVSLNPIIADVSQYYRYFSIEKHGKWGFSWNQGNLTGYNDKDERAEFLYAHFQKRILSVTNGDIPDSKFCIVPNRIINGCDYSPEIKLGNAFRRLERKISYYKKMMKGITQTNMRQKIACLETYQYCVKHGLIR